MQDEVSLFFGQTRLQSIMGDSRKGHVGDLPPCPLPSVSFANKQTTFFPIKGLWGWLIQLAMAVYSHHRLHI